MRPVVGPHLAAEFERDGRIAAVHAARHGARSGGLRELAHYWQAVREFYTPFESDMKAPDADLYLHEMPGGQFTNLQEQARALGLMARWPEICQTYADVNQLLGDIVKVTPTSKAVGDMALFLVTNNLTAGRRAGSEPRSGVSRIGDRFARGADGAEPGRISGGGAKARAARSEAGPRPARGVAAAGRFQSRRRKGEETARTASRRSQEVISYLLYPRVFQEFAAHRKDVFRHQHAAHAGVSLQPADRAKNCRSTSSRARR